MNKETEKPDPAILTKAEAESFLKLLEPALKAIEGKTGPGANIRTSLESAKNIAGNVK